MTWVCSRSSRTSLSRRQRPPRRSADWLRSGRLGIGWGHPLSGTKDWMGPPTPRYPGTVDGLDGATHSPVPRIGWGHPLSGTKEMWMASFVPLVAFLVSSQSEDPCLGAEEF